MVSLNKLKRNAYVFFLLLCINPIILCGQDLFNTPIPPPPEAAAFSVYGKHSVNLFSGTPNISIPLWQIQVGDFVLPIELNYNSGGITVSEIPTWVGAGWTLNAGGVLSRTVNGVPDNNSLGYLHSITRIPVHPSNFDVNEYDIIYSATSGGWDTEPDVFHYHAGNLSGKFAFDEDGNIHHLTFSNDSISTNNLSSLSSWIIKDSKGVIYSFDKPNNVVAAPGPGYYYTSTWSLSSITFPNTDKSIVFEYDVYNSVTEQPFSESLDRGNLKRTELRLNENDARRLKKITFPEGTIEFSEGTYRHDFQGSRVLDEVVVKDRKGNVIKRFKFDYAYFGQTGIVEFSQLSTATASTKANTKLRLMLRSVTECDKRGTCKPPYQLEYESSVWLPDRLTSKAVDHWGFYNGQNSNTTLIPRHFLEDGSLSPVGGNRFTSPSHVKAGSLNKIIYPTGGETSFLFEANEVHPQSQLPHNVETIRASSTVRQCDIIESSVFEVKDEVYSGVLFKMSINGSIFPGTTQQCGGVEIDPEETSTYLFYRIYEVSDPSSPEPVYISTGSFTIDGLPKNNEENIFLENGKYKIRVFKAYEDQEATNEDASFNGIYQLTLEGHQSVRGHKRVGGLKIAKMIDYDPISQKQTVKIYEYLNDHGYSSGIVNVVPKYGYKVYPPNGANAGPYVRMTSFSHAYSEKSNGYEKVTVYHGEGDAGEIGVNGKTEYYFSAPIDMVNEKIEIALNNQERWAFRDYYVNNAFEIHRVGGVQFPFAPTLSKAWRRGALEHQIDYKFVSPGVFVKVKELINSYKDDFFGDRNVYNRSRDVLGLKVGNLGVEGGNLYYFQYYYLPSRCYKLISQEEKIFEDDGSYFSNVTIYEYDDVDRVLLSRDIKYLNKNEKLVTQYLYPYDYTNTTGFIGEMKSANIISSPIETVSYQAKLDGGDIRVLNGRIITYKSGSKLGLLDKVWNLRSSQPILLSDFKFSNMASIGVLPQSESSSSFSLEAKDSHYPDESDVSLEFDLFRNITKIEKNKDVPNAYLWGYNQNYPIAEAINASPHEIAYSSFEDETAKGGWDYTYSSSTIVNSFKAGEHSFYNGTVTKSDLPAGNYVLSFWARSPSGTNSITGSVSVSVSSNSWKYYSFTLNNINSMTLNVGNVNIDELRLHPVHAQMKTYTYKPLVGVTSASDENSSQIFYHYDDLGRLEYTQDQDGNILKSFKYNYQVR
jgi:hypothetical protein